VPEARHFSAACFMEIEPNYPYLAILVAWNIFSTSKWRILFLGGLKPLKQLQNCG
jgi:hypothetical protein